MSLTAGDEALALEDLELWTLAHHILELYSDQFSLFIDARVSELALRGDDLGVWHWLRVVDYIDRLHAPVGGQVPH